MFLMMQKRFVTAHKTFSINNHAKTFSA